MVEGSARGGAEARTLAGPADLEPEPAIGASPHRLGPLQSNGRARDQKGPHAPAPQSKPGDPAAAGWIPHDVEVLHEHVKDRDFEKFGRSLLIRRRIAGAVGIRGPPA